MIRRVKPLREAIRQQKFQLQKGLERDEAFRRARNRATRDFRGFTYDPKTGKAVLT